MIYLPQEFDEKNRDRVLGLIRASPFATLIGIDGSSPLIGHLPLIAKTRPSDGGLTLVGHLAAQNPQARLPEGAVVTAVFHGPHTYVSPTWYAGPGVPTWNYAVVHAAGKLRWIRELRPLVALLREVTDIFEGAGKERWKFALPDDLKTESDLTNAIVGFEIEVETLEAKFKLSQNRTPEDRAGVLKNLEARPDEMSRKVLELMKDTPPQR